MKPATKTASEVTFSNLPKVYALFEKFGRGDIQAILEMCSQDCYWLHGGDPGAIPFARPFKGKQGVAEFFQTLIRTIAVSQLHPSAFQENGPVVSHHLHVEATVLATGKSYVANVQYAWTFDQHGLISHYSCTGDFSAAEAAFRA